MQPNANKWRYFGPLFLLLLCGCLIPPDGPVGPEPEHDTEIRRKIAQSLVGAEKQDCEKVYGIYRAAAEVVASEAFTASTVGELKSQVERTARGNNWTSGKYPEFSKVFEEVCDPLLGNADDTTMDKRQAISELFWSIALGARDAAK